MNFLKEVVLAIVIAAISCYGAPQKHHHLAANTDISDIQPIKTAIFADDIVKAIQNYLSRLERNGSGVYRPATSKALRHVGFADKLAKLHVLLELNKILPTFKSVHHEQHKL